MLTSLQRLFGKRNAPAGFEDTAMMEDLLAELRGRQGDRDRIATLEAQLTATQDELRLALDDAQDQLKMAEARADVSDSLYGDLLTTNERLVATLNAAQAERDALKGRLATTESERNHLSNQLADTQDLLHQATQSLNDHTSKRAPLEASMWEYEHRATELATLLDQAIRERDALKTKLSSITEDHRVLVAEHGALLNAYNDIAFPNAGANFQGPDFDPQDTKVCRSCGLPTPLDDFTRNRRNQDGLSTSCRFCEARSRRARAAARAQATNATIANQARVPLTSLKDLATMLGGNQEYTRQWLTRHTPTEIVRVPAPQGQGGPPRVFVTTRGCEAAKAHFMDPTPIPATALAQELHISTGALRSWLHRNAPQDIQTTPAPTYIGGPPRVTVTPSGAQLARNHYRTTHHARRHQGDPK